MNRDKNLNTDVDIDLDNDEDEDAIEELHLGVEVTQRRQRRFVPLAHAEQRTGSMHQAGDDLASRKNIPEMIRSACDPQLRSTPLDIRPRLRYGRT